MTLTARPTVYKGIQMRSRLEARFAAELDENGADWTYEPRAYADGHHQYLPDFEVRPHPGAPVPDKSYVEVRPNLQGAYRAMAQMAVIWASEPMASLLIVIPDEGLWFWASQRVGNAKWHIHRATP